MKKWIYSGTREEQPSERELMHGKLARKAASEGIVLLKNEGILPLKKDTAAALLGYGAEKTVKGGINRVSIEIEEGRNNRCNISEMSLAISSNHSVEEHSGQQQISKIRQNIQSIEVVVLEPGCKELNEHTIIQLGKEHSADFMPVEIFHSLTHMSSRIHCLVVPIQCRAIISDLSKPCHRDNKKN